MYQTVAMMMPVMMRARPTKVGMMVHARDTSQLGPTKSPSHDEQVPSPPWPAQWDRSQQQKIEPESVLTVIANSIHTCALLCTAVSKVAGITCADLWASAVPMVSITAVRIQHTTLKESGILQYFTLTMCRLVPHSRHPSSHFHTDIHLVYVHEDVT